MASKARQSLFGGFFELSLNLVIFSFFMRLGSSRRNDANDSTPHGIGDAKHSAVDQADRIETQLLGGTEIIEVDDIGIEERLAAVSKSIPCLLCTLARCAELGNVTHPTPSLVAGQTSV